MQVLTPEEIADVVYGDHSPLQTLTLDEAKKRIAELIYEYAQSLKDDKQGSI